MSAGPVEEQEQPFTPFALTGNVTAESVTEDSINLYQYQFVNPNGSKT